MLVATVCYTNLDNYERYHWPTKMFNPRIGDRVCARNDSAQLYISSIAHVQTKHGDVYLYIHLSGAV